MRREPARHRRLGQADPLAAAGPVRDARAQPPVVEARAAAQLRPARGVRRLDVGLGVLSGPGARAPGARELRKAQGLCAAGPSDASQCQKFLSELIPLAARRAGGLTWEYYFKFDGGDPAMDERDVAGHGPAGACRRVAVAARPLLPRRRAPGAAGVHPAPAGRRSGQDPARQPLPAVLVRTRRRATT